MTTSNSNSAIQTHARQVDALAAQGHNKKAYELAQKNKVQVIFCFTTSNDDRGYRSYTQYQVQVSKHRIATFSGRDCRIIKNNLTDKWQVIDVATGLRIIGDFDDYEELRAELGTLSQEFIARTMATMEAMEAMERLTGLVSYQQSALEEMMGETA